jgi:hypothetical protein
MAGLGSVHDQRGAFPRRCSCPRLSAGRAGCTRLAHVTTRNHGGRDDGQELPDQNATVVIGEGVEKETWLLVSGVIERRITPINSDVADPGKEPAVEIV